MNAPITHTNEQAIDAALAAWFGVTKVMPERQILRERMEAAIVAFNAAAPAVSEPVAAKLDDMAVYRAAVDVRDWANALGTMLENKPALLASIDRLRSMVATPAPAAQGLGDAVRDVLAERRRQDEKWGGPEHDDELTTGQFLDLIIDQKRKATPEFDAGRRKRLVKIAALAVAAAESIDRLSASRTTPTL